MFALPSERPARVSLAVAVAQPRSASVLAVTGPSVKAEPVSDEIKVISEQLIIMKKKKAELTKLVDRAEDPS